MPRRDDGSRPSLMARLLGRPRPRQRTGIHLYTMSWNEERMLGFFFRHYDEIVDRYVIYDDGSDDRTLAILAAHPRVEVRRFERTVADSFVYSAQRLQDSMWKESRADADWVIVTAIDEHLHHPDLTGYLEACRMVGITAVPALGYQMLSSDFPRADEHLVRSRTRGAPYRTMNKLSIFSPRAVEESGFAVGRHGAKPRGNVVYPPVDRVLLLHYKYIGLGYAAGRDASLGARLGAGDLKDKLGFHYFLGDAGMQAEMDSLQKYAIDVLDPAYDHHRENTEPRWWRKRPPTPPLATAP